MKTILSLLFIVSALVAQANPLLMLAGAGVSSTTTANLLTETWAGSNSGCDNVWTITGSSYVNTDYSANHVRVFPTAAMAGLYIDVTASAHTYIKIPFSWVTQSTAGAILLKAGTTTVCTIYPLSAGSIRIIHGSTAAATTATLPASTEGTLWIHYAPGTGTNGVAELAWSTDGIRPTSGNNYCTTSTGTATGQVSRIQLGASGTSTTSDYIFGTIQVSSTGYP